MLRDARCQNLRRRRARPLAHIENRLHWALDVAFHGDLARLLTGSEPQKMAIVKHIAMNLVRAQSDKHSLKVRRKLANLNPDYLETLVRTKAPLT